MSDYMKKNSDQEKCATEKDKLQEYEKIRCLSLMGDVRMCYSAFYQFHQYYIHGKFDLCKEYKNRVKNCIKWRTFQSVEAKEKLIESLEAEKINMHTPNPVWKIRDSPPKDW